MLLDCQMDLLKSCLLTLQGRIQDFKLGGGALKKIAPSRGRRENFWGSSCEKSRFYAKKIIFFPILGGRAWIAPDINMSYFYKLMRLLYYQATFLYSFVVIQHYLVQD
jgi:hypothetical protein